MGKSWLGLNKHKAVYRYSARSTIGIVPPRLSETETAKQLTIAKTGTPQERSQAVENLIQGHIGLAGAIAAKFTAKVPNKGDEILAYAMYLLVTSTNRIACGELMTHHNNYDAYISVVLNRYIQRHLNQDYTIKPHTNDPKILEEEIRRDPEDFKDKYTPRELTESKAVSPAADRDFGLVVRDIVVNSGFFSMVEQAVILLRIQGYDDIEIGQKLGVSKQYVQQKREGMRGKLERCTGEKS